jgi:hypothetical protein
LSRPCVEDTVSEEDSKERAGPRLRQTVVDEKDSEGVCHYRQSEVGREHLTMDHVVPLSRGKAAAETSFLHANLQQQEEVPAPIEDEYLQSLRNDLPRSSLPTRTNAPTISFLNPMYSGVWALTAISIRLDADQAEVLFAVRVNAVELNHQFDFNARRRGFRNQFPCRDVQTVSVVHWMIWPYRNSP